MAGSEWAVVAAAVVGLAGSPLTVLVTEWIRNRPNRLDEARKGLLKKMLNDTQHNWRALETLSSVTGADEETTKRLLLEIGARGSENNPSLWGLVSRNPLPTLE